jgi:KDO2-lipid IV(A) lauroyltransferase
VRRRSDYPAYVLLRALTAVVRPWPRGVALGAGATLGRAARDLFGMRRDVADRNLAAAFPALTHAQRARLARRMYAHFGRVAVDSLRLTARGSSAVVPFVRTVEGEAAFRALAAAGRGVIMVAGHHGNWELGAAWIAAAGIPVAAVVKPAANPWVAGYVERSRRAMGIESIPMPTARVAVPAALAAGKVVGLVADQGAMRGDTWAPFFGRPTKTAEGPGLFAARTGAPVIFADLIAEPDGRYRGLVEVLDESPRGEGRELAARIAVLFRRSLEAVVRQAPEQYLWTHRLWARQPPGVPAVP